MNGRDRDRIAAIQGCWGSLVSGGGTPVRVDQENTLHVFCVSRQQQEALTAAGEELVLALNGKVEKRKRGRFPDLVRIEPHLVDSGTMVLAEALADLQRDT